MPFDNPAAVLDDMINRLPTPDVWCRYTMYEASNPPRFCIVGALNMADHGDAFSAVAGYGDVCKFSTKAAWQASQALWEHLPPKEKYFPNLSGVCNFNNDPTVSHEDVMALIATRASL